MLIFHCAPKAGNGLQKGGGGKPHCKLKPDRSWHMIVATQVADNFNVQLPLRGEELWSIGIFCSQN
jgi:hypothetical protein